MGEVLQLKITLAGTKPTIYRQVLVKKNTTFFELHHIIQISMGWENSHMFEFYFNNYRIALPNDEIDFDDDKIIDAAAVELGSVIVDENEKFEYEYDFGDCWRHQIVVEKFLPLDKAISYPFCIKGENKCPPEDCGGVQGYYEMLKIISNKKDPEYKEMMTWLGNKSNPEFFDNKAVNKQLSELGDYIIKWLDNQE